MTQNSLKWILNRSLNILKNLKKITLTCRRHFRVTWSEAGAATLNVNVSSDPEVVQGVREEDPFVLRSKKYRNADTNLKTTILSHLNFEYSAGQASIVLVVFSPKQVSHPKMFNEVRNSFGGELK